MIDFKQLRYFCTIVEEGTVIGAANRLHMTQPPLTAQMHLLEKELNCELFIRDGRKLSLTDAGKHFYEKSKALLHMCDSVVNEMMDYQDGANGILRIGVVSSVQDALFIKWLASFHKLYPNIRYDLYSENTYQLLEQLKNGMLDLALVRTPFMNSGFKTLSLKKEQLFAVGKAELFHSDMQQKDSSNNSTASHISLQELSQKPLILYRRWEKILKANFEAMGYETQIQCSNDNAQMTLALAKEGMGIGVLPASALLNQSYKNLEIRTITNPSFSSEITLICQKDKSLPRAAELFWDMLETQIK